jgi:uncharacterized protein (UPF0335 family)
MSTELGEDLARVAPASALAADGEIAAIADRLNKIGKPAAKGGDQGEASAAKETIVEPAAEASPGGSGGGNVDESEASGEFAADRLRSFIERIERLDEEKQAISADTREIFAEAKGSGFDVKAIRGILRLRKLDKADREEQDALLDLYRSTLGV